MYQTKTMINRLFSIERMCGFFYEEVNLLRQYGITSALKTPQFERKLKAMIAFIRCETKVLSPLATKCTQIRNCRESLISENKWINIEELFKCLNGIIYLVY
jgi:hypothetical protein